MKANILIIDDEDSIRFSFSRFLTAEGHNVITAKNYREALARMNKQGFEVILADIYLGDGWGIDILQEVMEKGCKTQVIIITAYPSSETAQDSIRMHAADYLVKPQTQEGLLEAVRKALHQGRA
jgi:DNA-binding NtrC family response regulator